jgi:hypothetical protein
MFPPFRLRAGCGLLLVALLATAVPAGAQEPERESLESLRQTTLALIEALVASGALPREKADQLIAEAQRRGRAAAALAAAPAAPAAPAPSPSAAAPAPPVVRVPYVPQVVRDQIRDELREEITARAKLERWGVPNALPEWTDRIAIEGDLRVRLQGDHYQSGNPAPLDFLAASLSGVTRAVDLAAGSSTGLPTANTQDERNRLRLRARLAFNAKVADSVSAGLRLATGSASDRVSTNQTLGNNLNRYTLLLDRAFIKLDPSEWLSVSAGRMPNPWFSTDLVWSENLNFDGVTAAFKRPLTPTAEWLPFATLGYFPIRESAPPRQSRSIVGAQIGVQWEFSPLTRLRLGLAQYRFVGFSGEIDRDYDPVTGPGRSYGQYEYEAGLRQRGNTLFLTNHPQEIAAGLTPDKARWGLAAQFAPVALTAAAEFSHFAPYVIGLTGEVVRNTAYGRVDVHERTGVWLDDARVFGVQLRATIGTAQLRNAGDWQASLAYRWLGSDAVPDAFVDSDLVLGGTNVRGWTLGLQYGLARETQLGLRVLSGRTISSPTVQPVAKDRFGVDSMQLDLNVRF